MTKDLAMITTLPEVHVLNSEGFIKRLQKDYKKEQGMHEGRISDRKWEELAYSASSSHFS